MKKSSLKSGTSTESPDALPRGIGRPATRALALIGVTRLSQLTKMTEEEVLSLHGVGPKAVGILREVLQKSGRAFHDGEGP